MSRLRLAALILALSAGTARAQFAPQDWPADQSGIGIYYLYGAAGVEAGGNVATAAQLSVWPMQVHQGAGGGGLIGVDGTQFLFQAGIYGSGAPPAVWWSGATSSPYCLGIGSVAPIVGGPGCESSLTIRDTTTIGTTITLDNVGGNLEQYLMGHGNSDHAVMYYDASNNMHIATAQPIPSSGGDIIFDPFANLNVSTFAGVGTRCVQVDSTGNVSPATAGCSSGAGTVTSVTGTSGQILCTPTSPNPVCSLVAAGSAGSCTNCSVTFDALGRETAQTSGTGAIVSGSASTTAINLGTSVSNAIVACSTASSICTPTGVTVAGGLAYNTGTATETLGSFTCGAGAFVSSSSTSGLACATPGYPVTSVTGANGVTCSPTTGAVGCTIANATCGANTFVSSASSGSGLVCTQPSFANLSGSATCAQLPALTGDATSSAGTCGTKVVEIHESGGLGIPIGACTTDGQAFVKVAGSMTCRLPSADLTNDYTAPWVTGMHDNSGASWPVNGNFSNGSVLSMAAGKLVAATVASQATKHDYFAVVSLTASIASGQFLPTSQSQFLATGLSSETPNDFQAGHVQMRMNFIACTGVSSTALTCFATLNGSGISGTGLSITCGTTSPGVQVGTAVPTGSTSANDVFGVECSAPAGLAGQLDTFSEQMVLTP